MEGAEKSEIDYDRLAIKGEATPITQPRLREADSNENISDGSTTGCAELTKTKRRKAIRIALLCLAIFSVLSGYSLISPFFPHLAKQKGLTETQIGIIFSLFSAVVFVMAPVYGILVSIGTMLSNAARLV